jgi:hypothetical protein
MKPGSCALPCYGIEFAVVDPATRSLVWKIPKFKEIRDATLVKKGTNYNLADLKKLTDPAVLYRLPDGSL